MSKTGRKWRSLAANSVSSEHQKAPNTPFSEPWKSSNLVLAVEDKKFHVHRELLIVCSPVFEAMLSSNFKEKFALEISLPEKKADEIGELLEAIYPDRDYCITKENCFFLLKLSTEYQIDRLKAHCEQYLYAWCNKDITRDEAMEVIVLSQNYMLDDKIVQACMTKFVCEPDLSWDDLKKHRLYSALEPAIAQLITEERVRYLEKWRPKKKTTTTKLILHPRSSSSSSED